MVSGLFHPVSELTFMVGVLQISESGGRTHLYQVLVVLNSLVLKAQLLALNIFQKQVTGIIMRCFQPINQTSRSPKDTSKGNYLWFP